MATPRIFWGMSDVKRLFLGEVPESMKALSTIDA